jgi:hypothetical protein
MEAVKPIAVVQGAPSEVVQGLFRDFIARLDPAVRLAGVVEDPAPPAESACNAGALKSLSDGRYFPIMQDLGPGVVACRLDSEGVVSACDSVQAGIRAGADLVILSKFGKIEVERSGLAAAFADALQAGLPILTSVSPKLNDAWDSFAAPLYVKLPPDLAAIEAWWQSVHARQRAWRAAEVAATP